MTDYNMNTTDQGDTNKYDNDFDYDAYRRQVTFIMQVATRIIISIGLPLTLMAISALCRLIRKDHVGPIYVINLLISDLIQLCCLMVVEIQGRMFEDNAFYSYFCGLVISVCFMVCISLERYLVIAHPLWYRFKRTIKSSVVVCVVVWIIPPAFYLIIFPWISFDVIHSVMNPVFAIFLLTPLPLFIFFLVGTLRALSASVSVSSEEKRRIVGILVLVLLIYTLLFLPSIIISLEIGKRFSDHMIFVFMFGRNDKILSIISPMFLKLSPLADLILYFFMRKQPFGKLCTTANCCRVANTDANIELV